MITFTELLLFLESHRIYTSKRREFSIILHLSCTIIFAIEVFEATCTGKNAWNYKVSNSGVEIQIDVACVLCIDDKME